MPHSLIDSSLPDWAKLLVAALCLVTPFPIVWFRSGSTHTIWSRIWKLANGKSHKSKSALQVALDERDLLMEFRVRTGVKARTTKLAVAIQTWCDEHDEEIGDVGKCGSYFDLEKVEPKKPPPWLLQVPLYFVMVAFIVVSVFLVGTALTPRILSIVPSTGHLWITLGEEDARTFWTHQHFSSAACSNKANVVTETGVSENDVQIICGWLNQRDYKSEFPSQIRMQRISAAYLLGIIFLPTYLICMWFSSGIAALAMFKRQQAKDSKGGPPVSTAGSAEVAVEPANKTSRAKRSAARHVETENN